MPKHLIDYIRHPEIVDAQALTQLKGLVDKYPYYHAARIQYLRMLYQTHNTLFDGELRRAAICLPSRKTLFELFEGQNVLPENPLRNSGQQKPLEYGTNTHTTDATEEFLSDFLSTRIPTEPKSDAEIADAHQDYMEWLVHSGGMAQSEENLPSMGQEKIDAFLDESHGHIELEELSENDDDDTLPTEQQPQKDLPESQLTEALAHIYIKQKQYEKARNIILRIIERKGELGKHQADQLRFLDKLIINQNNISDNYK